MLRLASYDIVFQEVPGEVTLALNISGCPNGCPGCHSAHLQEETGEVMDDGLMAGLLDIYGGSVTCVCFMGGDREPSEVERLSVMVRSNSGGKLKTAWYSGKERMPAGVSPDSFDYIKLGPYVAKLGGLTSPETNQRFYRVEAGNMVDITTVFR